MHRPPPLAVLLLGPAIAAAQPLYTVLPVDAARTPDDLILPEVVNDRGEVVGVAYDTLGGDRYSAWRWRPGEAAQDMGTLGPWPSDAGWNVTVVDDINATGLAVGDSSNADNQPEAFVWDEADGIRSIAADLPGRSTAYAVNGRGLVVGAYADFRRPFLYDSRRGRRTTFELCAADDSACSAEPVDINDRDQVLIRHHGAAATAWWLWTPGRGFQAVPLQLERGRMALTEDGTVLAGDRLWSSRDGSVRRLGGVADQPAQAYAGNGAGIVVGSQDGEPRSRAVLWDAALTPRLIADLIDPLDDFHGLDPLYASSVNRAGVLAVRDHFDPFAGDPTATGFLLVPYALDVARAPDRGAPSPLDGATLAAGEPVCIVAAPALAVVQAEFRVDGVAAATELQAPLDLYGTARDGGCRPLLPADLGIGEHRVEVVLRLADGRFALRRALFRVH